MGSVLTGSPPVVSRGSRQLVSFLLTDELPTRQVFASFNSATSHFASSYGEDHGDGDHRLYGEHFLYFHYLYQQCGGGGFLKTLVAKMAAYPGIFAIEKTLVERGMAAPSCRDFVASYIGYSIARVLNREVAGANTFQVIPNSTARVFPREKLQEGSFDITDLELLDSVYIKAQSFISTNIPDSIASFWIRHQPPYEVRSLEPTFGEEFDPSSWAVLLIKLEQ